MSCSISLTGEENGLRKRVDCFELYFLLSTLVHYNVSCEVNKFIHSQDIIYLIRSAGRTLDWFTQFNASGM